MVQVMEMMLGIDFRNKKVIDMGCGTGILAIQAMKQGASSAIAIDNDANAVDNTRDKVLTAITAQCRPEADRALRTAGRVSAARRRRP